MSPSKLGCVLPNNGNSGRRGSGRGFDAQGHVPEVDPGHSGCGVLGRLGYKALGLGSAQSILGPSPPPTGEAVADCPRVRVAPSPGTPAHTLSPIPLLVSLLQAQGILVTPAPTLLRRVYVFKMALSGGVLAKARARVSSGDSSGAGTPDRGAVALPLAPRPFAAPLSPPRGLTCPGKSALGRFPQPRPERISASTTDRTKDNSFGRFCQHRANEMNFLVAQYQVSIQPTERHHQPPKECPPPTQGCLPVWIDIRKEGINSKHS